MQPSMLFSHLILLLPRHLAVFHHYCSLMPAHARLASHALQRSCLILLEFRQEAAYARVCSGPAS